MAAPTAPPSTAAGPARASARASLAKAISWRVVGTLDTILLSWLILGRIDQALTIGGLELITKIALYYAHERVWERVDYGRAAGRKDKRRRSVAKTVSWRATATVDTFILSFLVTHKPFSAAGIAGAEIVTKTVLYYLHERAWSWLQR